jgi:predicted lipid-binding transport protein (Tim44 family)
MQLSRAWRWTSVFAAVFLAFSMVAVDQADARRGGSFGSRGMRTFQAPAPTQTAPKQVAPVERSMSPGTTTNSVTRPTPAAQQRPGLFGGLAGGLLGGLMLGGLIGLLMGTGFGGLAGMFGMLLQILLIGGAIMLALRFFRGSQAPAMAGAGRGFGKPGMARQEDDGPRGTSRAGGFTIPGFGSQPHGSPASKDIELTQRDLDTFERPLSEVQEAFGQEDHSALRRVATPEIVSYLSEELADNAKRGVHNEVSDVRLLQADVAEAWSEGDRDYATAAFRYESRDVAVDRATGEVVDGDADNPTETVELWTFTRPTGGEWKLSAIQEA